MRSHYLHYDEVHVVYLHYNAINVTEATKKVGDLIRQTRRAKGLTQKELGEKLGIGDPTINKYESGKQNPTVETLEKIAQVLNVELIITFK
jgi:UDP-N-acetylglucosamine 1-carboxyvinyltransferase